MALPSDDPEFFDAAFLAELEELASAAPTAALPAAAALRERLSSFLAPGPGENDPMTAERFVELAGPALFERTNALTEICRKAGGAPARAVESFIVFFQALIPTLRDDGARQIKQVFYRLVPSLVQIAAGQEGSEEGAEATGALANLEAILIEISSIRLAPTESELVFRSIDHMAAFIASGDYAMANQLISEQLLGLIRRNRLARSLYRLMEVEVNVQRYLKERLGYATPQIDLPGDVSRLEEYGPIRILEEDLPDGGRRRFLQFHIPDVPILRDIVLHLVSQETGRSYDFRLDALGASTLDVPDGAYSLGLAYEPPS